MSKKTFTEAEIVQIINDCNLLFVPEGSTLPEADVKPPVALKKSNILISRYFNKLPETKFNPVQNDESEDFEKIFNDSKLKKQSICFQPPEDFTETLNAYEDESPSDYAIRVNTEVRNKLTEFRSIIQTLLIKINARVEANAKYLQEAKSKDIKDSTAFKISYLRCGMPFFKDTLGYPLPENDDFNTRKNKLKEFFPFDHPYKGSQWTIDAKIGLLQGVKKQMIDYIKMQQSQKVCEENKTRRKFQKLKLISNNEDLDRMTIGELYKFTQTDHPSFEINWNLISFKDLQSKQTVAECMGMWYSYLKPDINRDPFSDEENAILSHVAVEYKLQDWEAISKHLNRRTPLQAFIHFFSSSLRMCPPNVRWTPEEDKELLEAIQQNTLTGNVAWNKVGLAIEGRNRVQCYNRFLILKRYNGDKKGAFTPAENRVLLEYIGKYGANFNKMPKELLPQRSIVQIKNHYNVALKHKGHINPWTYEEDIKLMDFVEKEGPNWSKLADMLQTHNRLSCRTRHLTITKFLKKNPSKSVRDVPSRLKTVTAVHKAVDDYEQDEPDVLDEVVETNEGAVEKMKNFHISLNELRNKNPMLYDLLLTTYNYNLNDAEINIDPKKFLVLKNLFDVGHDSLKKKHVTLIFPKNQLFALRHSLNGGLGMKIRNELTLIKTYTQFLLPPNFNSAIGLRALAIKMQEDSLIDEDQSEESEMGDTLKNKIESFRKNFFSLFYWTAMVSKIDPNELRQIHLVKNPKTTSVDIYRFINQNETEPSNCRLPKRKADTIQGSSKQKKTKMSTETC